MGAKPLVSVFVLTIFQVVTAVLSGFPGKSQPQAQPGIVYEYPPVLKNSETAQGASTQPTTGQNYVSLNDISEIQLPRPPTQNELLSQENVFSGAGNLETNEIVRNPSTQPKLDTSSITMQNNAQPQTTKDAPANNMMSYPDLDKAVENAVNSLPTSSDNALVPLIKIYNERIDENLKNTDMNQEDAARKWRLQKRIVLKLAKKAQKLQEENDIQAANENIVKNLMQAQKEAENPMKIETNVQNDNDCDCEGGCMVVVSQNQLPPGMLGGNEEAPNQLAETKPEKDSVAQPEGMKDLTGAGISKAEHTEEGCMSEDKGENSDDRSPDLLGHLLIILKVHKEGDEIQDVRNVPQTPFPLSRELPLQSPEVANPTFSIKLSKNSVSLNTLNINEEGSNVEKLLTGLISGGIGGNVNDDENDRESGGTLVRLTANEIVNDSDDYQSPVVDIAPGNQIPTFQGVNGQNIPKGLFLWKILSEAIKQKAAAEAFRGIQENQIPSLPSTGEIQNPSLSQGPRIVILTKGGNHGSNIPPLHFPGEESGATIQFLPRDASQGNSESNSSFDSKSKTSFEMKNDYQGSSLPPLHFPDENSGVKIQFLSRDTKQDNSESSSSSDSNRKTLNEIKNFAPTQEMNTPQNLPWFIRKIIKNLSQPQRDLQPIPNPTVPSQNGDGDNLVLLRAMLAPYTL